MINHDNCRTPSRFIIPFPMLAAVQIPFFDISLSLVFYIHFILFVRALVSNNATHLHQFVCFIVVIKFMNVVIVVVVVVVVVVIIGVLVFVAVVALFIS